MAVVAETSPTMTVTVSQGTAGIPVGTYPSSYDYWVGIDTTTGSPAGETVTIATASSSNPRIDAVVAYVDLSVTASSGTPNNTNNMLKLVSVAGTPAGSPVAPTGAAIQSAIGGSNPYILLAQVLVGTSVTQINNGNITDKRNFMRTTGFNPYKFHVHRAAALNTANAASAAVAFDTKDYDTGTNIDVVTNKGRFTAPAAGFYRFDGAIDLVSGGTLEAIISLYKNGAETTRGGRETIVSSHDVGIVVGDTIQLAANDYVEIYVFSSGTTAFTVGTVTPYFSGSLQSLF